MKYRVCFPLGLFSKHKQIYCREDSGSGYRRRAEERWEAGIDKGKGLGLVFSCEIDFFDIEATGIVSKLNGIVKISSEYQLNGEIYSPDPKTFHCHWIW